MLPLLLLKPEELDWYAIVLTDVKDPEYKMPEHAGAGVGVGEGDGEGVGVGVGDGVWTGVGVGVGDGTL